MGIQALPQATVRTLGASQVLNDAVAVVKELLDNGIDAHATSIAIEISSNTLDSIQVRDNGHGIPALDRSLVARPHCTSKIDGIDDLKVIGGSSLGFRGEALASIAEMSGSLTISTRVEGEQVASVLKINQRGEVEGQDRASLPVGTTVKATDFMKTHPVRKQVTLKNAEKTLAKIKHMLQSYAFARPNIRISLRVLKSKNDSGNWIYAPKASASAEDVALKISGTRCVSQCVWSVFEDYGFTLQAFLPKSDADASKFSNIGCFFSVDARPVSTSKGTPKKIAKLFRELLRKANPSFENVKDPLIYLNISCPPASYDANVEPAKDDVLFETPEIVLKTARRLFDAVYPVSYPKPSEPSVNAITTVSQQGVNLDIHGPLPPATQATLDQLSNDATFDSIDLDELHVSRPAASPHVPDEFPRTMNDAQWATKAFRSNMYGCDEEDLDLIEARPPTGRIEAEVEELRQARKDVNLSNPWVIAKLKSPTKRSAQSQDDGRNTGMDVTTSEVNNTSSIFQTRPAIDLEAPGLPTPRASSPSRPRSSFHPSDHVPNSRFAGDGRMIGSQALPPPQMLIDARSPQAGMSEDVHPQHQLRQAPTYDYMLSSQTAEQVQSTALHDIPNASESRPRANKKQQVGYDNNPPYRPPVRIQQPDWEENGAAYRKGRKSSRPPRDTAGLVMQGEIGDLVEEPRPLTPPMRNRDMRDFVTSIDLTADNSVASLIESRNYPRKRRTRSFDRPLDWFGESNEENTRAPPGITSGTGFVPASELTALEARIGSVKNDGSRAAKRRKTSESRVLREISANLDYAGRGEDQDRRAKDDRRTASRRRSTTGGSKVRRTKSAQLPLERTPVGQAVQSIVLSISVSEQDIARLAGKIDEECSIAGSKEPVTDMYAALTVKPSSNMISQWTANLHQLLVHRVSDGEMVQDLGVLVSSAFDTLDRASDEAMCA
jgi:DNA mismatch repair protein MutL